jgi:cytoskeletal protein CcmA (bactofilin family)
LHLAGQRDRGIKAVDPAPGRDAGRGIGRLTGAIMPGASQAARMNNPLNRRLKDQFAASPTFIAEGTSFVGDIETSGALVVCGKVRGNGRIGGAVSLARGAEWHGDIEAKQAVIAGSVLGDLSIEGSLEIGASAVISGRVTAKSLAIANGAVIESDVSVTSGEPVLRFEEKRIAD